MFFHIKDIMQKLHASVRNRTQKKSGHSESTLPNYHRVDGRGYTQNDQYGQPFKVYKGQSLIVHMRESLYNIT